MNRKVGLQAEAVAQRYLESQGLTCLDKNYSCKLGEIDLIMQDQDDIVFVEVRYRESDNFELAIDSIDRNKQNRIIQTATTYLLDKNLWDKVGCRFDVIGVGEHDDQFEWIQDAFEL